jgi:hypothetical protein
VLEIDDAAIAEVVTFTVNAVDAAELPEAIVHVTV